MHGCCKLLVVALFVGCVVAALTGGFARAARAVLVEVPLPPVSPLTKLQALPAALELVEAVLLQNASMGHLLRYRDMRPPAKAWPPACSVVSHH